MERGGARGEGAYVRVLNGGGVVSVTSAIRIRCLGAAVRLCACLLVVRRSFLNCCTTVVLMFLCLVVLPPSYVGAKK
jgi:hypothetical protein